MAYQTFPCTWKSREWRLVCAQQTLRCSSPLILGSILHCFLAPFPPGFGCSRGETAVRGVLRVTAFTVTVPLGSVTTSRNAVCLHFQRLWGTVWVKGGMLADHTQRLLSPLQGDCGVSLQITIPRGSDGFGFTICCDSPVRVQAVDSGKRSDHFYPS